MNPRSPSLKVDSQNPLSSGSSSVAPIKKLDTLAGSVLITDDEWKRFLSSLKACKDNEERLSLLEKDKTPYLFTSAHLMTLIEITLSVKTRIGFIEKVGPRLTDPRARANEFIGMFRYSEEKQKVEEVLKARTQVLASSLFRSSAVGTNGAASLDTKNQLQSQEQQQTSGKQAVVPFLGIKGLAGARQRADPTVVTKHTLIMPPTTATTSMATSSNTTKKSQSEKAPMRIGGGASSHQTVLASSSNSSLAQLAAAKHASSGIQRLLDDDDHMRFAWATKDKTRSSGDASCSIVVASLATMHPPSSSGMTSPDYRNTATTPRSLRPLDVPEEARQSFSSTGSTNFKNFSPKYLPGGQGGHVLTSDGTTAALARLVDVNDGRSESPTQSVGSLSRNSSIGSSDIVEDFFDNGNTTSTTHSNRVELDNQFGETETVLSWRQTRRGFVSVRDLAVGFNRSKTNTTASVSSSPQVSPEHASLSGKETKDGLTVHTTSTTMSIAPEPRMHDAFTNKISPAGNSVHRSSLSSTSVTTAEGRGYWNSMREAARPISNVVAAVAGRMGADLGYYRDLPPEGPISTDTEGLHYFRYNEMVRKNLVKDYQGIIHTTELERHCDDSEFSEMFGVSKEDFAKLPMWKRQQLRKDLLLF